MRNFTIKDISGGGQYLVAITPVQEAQIINGETPHVRDTGFLSTIMFKIGYIHANTEFEDNRTCLTAMSDGWTRMGHLITDDKDGNSLATKDWIFVPWDNSVKNNTKPFIEFLNNDTHCTREMRFATEEEVVRVIMYQKHRWRNNQQRTTCPIST